MHSILKKKSLFHSFYAIEIAITKHVRTYVLKCRDSSVGDARHLRQECYTSQRVRSERDSNLTYVLRADHEFHCSNTAPVNHKVPGGVSTLGDSHVTSPESCH